MSVVAGFFSAGILRTVAIPSDGCLRKKWLDSQRNFHGCACDSETQYSRKYRDNTFIFSTKPKFLHGVAFTTHYYFLCSLLVQIRCATNRPCFSINLFSTVISRLQTYLYVTIAFNGQFMLCSSAVVNSSSRRYADFLESLSKVAPSTSRLCWRQPLYSWYNAQLIACNWPQQLKWLTADNDSQ